MDDGTAWPHNFRLTPERLVMAVAESFRIKVSDIMYTIRRFYPWPQPTQQSQKPGKCSPNTEACFEPRRRCGLGFTRVPCGRWRHRTGRTRTLPALHGTTAFKPGPGANRDPDPTGRRLPCLGPGTSRANHPGSAQCRHRATQSRAGSEG